MKKIILPLIILLVSLVGKIIKFERPQLLMIDEEPAYLYVTSGYHFFGKESTASYVMRFKNGKNE